MRKNKALAAIACTLTIGASLCVGLTACGGAKDPGVYKGVDVEKGIIYVGNTAGTTGALASIGLPFNYGINAAFYEYNENGGFSGTYNGEEVSGLKVALKHYDDGGVGANAATYTERLIEEDEVFAIVGNYGAYAVNTNLDIIKDARVPMVYAAAGNQELSSDNAKGDDRFIFPVQPTNDNDGRALLLRAFLPLGNGGLGGTKVGVITNSDEASLSILKGIEAEAKNLPEAQKNNINYQPVSNTDTGYANAATALKDAGCDVIIVALTTDYIKTISALMDAGFTSENVKVLTSYNNSASTNFDKDGQFNTAYASLINSIYSMGWIDTTNDDYKYNTAGGLLTAYDAFYWEIFEQYVAYGTFDDANDPTTWRPYTDAELAFCKQFYTFTGGVGGFNAEYWSAAEALFNYGALNPSELPTSYKPLDLSYNAYALAGYIAGNLFCQGLEAMEESQLELTRTNFVDAMESKTMHIAMSVDISYADGKRLGVATFTLNKFSVGTTGATGSTMIEHVATLDELRAKNNG